jgi:hypothetical protein
MANGPEETRKEFKAIAEETAVIFGETLQTIASRFSTQLREQANELDDLSKTLLRNFKNDISSLARSASGLLNVQDKLRDGILKQSDISKEIQGINSKINKVLLDRQTIIRATGGLTAQQEEDFQNALDITKKQVDQLRAQSQLLAEIDSSLGPIGSGFKVVGGLLKKIGLDDPFTEVLQNTKAARGQIALNTQAVNDLRDSTGKIPAEHRKTAISLLKQNQSLKSQAKLSTQITASLKSRLTLSNLLAVAATKVLASIFDVNKAQTEFRRQVGESADGIGLLNSGLLTSVDLIQTQVALSEQFGLNAREAFGSETLQEVGELTKAVGLSAEESGNFARFSAITGTNLNNQLDSLTKSIPKAFNQRQILQQTANVTNDIALAFDNQVDLIGDAVVKAKQLGLTLGDVNQIADSLLDIESSLAAEFEAEVITGKSLNFERARFFALTNDLAGLTDEIKNNEEIINSFAGATRIEQESIAKAFGMSRQQMADMVMSSKLINTLSDEQRANAAGVSIEQLKQLDIQQSLSDSINKLTQALAGPLEKFASLVQFAVKFSDALLVGAGVFTILNNKTKIQAGLQATIGALQNKNLLKGIADMAISAYTSVAKIPFIGPILGAAAAAAAFALGKSYISKGDDIVSEGYGARTLMGPEGSIALNDRDTVIAGTNLFPQDRTETRITPTTVTLSDAQIQKIANAVRDGASRATINLDGDKVSSRLQTPMVLNTLPGV